MIRNLHKKDLDLEAMLVYIDIKKTGRINFQPECLMQIYSIFRSFDFVQDSAKPLPKPGMSGML